MHLKSKTKQWPTVVLDFHHIQDQKENSDTNNSGEDPHVELLKEPSPKVTEEINTIEYDDERINAERTSNSSFSV